jgi:hypothetical protein
MHSGGWPRSRVTSRLQAKILVSQVTFLQAGPFDLLLTWAQQVSRSKELIEMQSTLKTPLGACVCALFFSLLTIGFGVSRLNAQAATAIISGTVTDSSGAVLPSSSIQVKNTGTGTVQNTTADPQGRYRVPDLPVGTYDVQATNAGFQTVIHRGITLTVGSQPVVDFSLPVGQASQAVTVEAQVSQVETSTATVSSLVNETQMRDLPLNGRNYEQLILLAPGVQGVTNTGGSFYGGEANYSVAGSRPEGQAFLLDNTDISGFWGHAAGSGATGQSLGVEAIQEFRTLTNTYSAQFGGNGAVVNAVSKSGSNAFHGSAYEFLRNSVFDARNFFDGKDVPPFRRNQFGGSVGGPIKKDRIFFFVNYEGLRQLLGESKLADVPDNNARNGIVPVNGVNAFVGVAPNIASTLALYPAATAELGNGIGTATTVANQLAHENYVLARADFVLSQNDSLFIRYVSDRGNLTEPYSGSPAIPLWPELDLTSNDYGTIEEKRVISPTLINLIRFSVVRPTESASIINSESPLQFFPGSGREDGTVTVPGLTAIGATTTLPFYLVQNKFITEDDMYWTKGAHNISLGFSAERIQDNTYAPFQIGGAYTFSSLAAFLQGTPSQVVGALPGQTDATKDFRELLLTPFIHDEWKVTKKLTINIGLRYEWAANPVEIHHPMEALIDPPLTYNNPNAQFEPVTHAFASNPSKWNFDPRFGFAYDPFGDHKTAIRGGFGLFHDVIEARSFLSSYWLNPPYTTGVQIDPTYPTPFAGGGSPNKTTTSEGVDYDTHSTPYMMQYNLNVQHEFAGTVFTAGYVGSVGRHLFAMRDLNPPTLTTGPDGEPVFATLVNNKIVTNPLIDPNLGYIWTRAAIASSNYNSLQVSVVRPLSHRIQAQLFYTFSKSLDTNSQTFGLEGGGAAQNYQNPYNYSEDYGLSTFNRTNTFRGSILYNLPGKGALLGGWQLTGIVTASSGPPFTVFDGYNDSGLTGVGIGTVRPNVIAGCKVMVGDVREWYNPACFTPQAVGTVGDLGRDTLTGPGLFDTDVALLKDTRVEKISESFRVQFRAEFFNIFNHPNFNLPNQYVFQQTANGGGALTSTAGTITSTLPQNFAPPRQIQLALKFLF